MMQRYRECHDFFHALTGLPVIVEGEVALKAFEFANTVLPMTGLSMAAVARLKKAERARFFNTYLPWALGNGLKAKEVVNVYWVSHFRSGRIRTCSSSTNSSLNSITLIPRRYLPCDTLSQTGAAAVLVLNLYMPQCADDSS